MRLFSITEPVTLYILERQATKGGVWRIMFADPSLLIGGGVFEDINWEENRSLWAPFSTQSPIYKKIGVPGTDDLGAAVKAYEALSKTLAQGAAVRLRQLTISIEAEVLYEDERQLINLEEVEAQLKKRTKGTGPELDALSDSQLNKTEPKRRKKRRGRKKPRTEQRPKSTWSRSRSKHA